MKHKKLFAFMIILSTLIACFNISISADDIWNGAEEAYIISGRDFEYLNDTWEVDFTSSEYVAYIIYNNQKLYVIEKISPYDYILGNENLQIETPIAEYDVYINRDLYDYWVSEEGYVPTINIIQNKTGAKDVFNIAVNTTRDVAFGFFETFWNNGLTFWGWLIAVAFGLITTFNIIKMISNSL